MHRYALSCRSCDTIEKEHMASKITVGKIVASTTDAGWSQAYHAGGFTAVVSVSPASDEKNESLQKSGKEILDTLVSEYFTLPTKDLETVKQAVTTTIEKAPEQVTTTLVVAAVVKNVLYVVIATAGRVLLKRGEKLGLLLEVKEGQEEKIASVSGFLETGDIVLLHTPAFGILFPHDQLVESFDHKNAEELAEIFAPKVHEAHVGTASALVFSYHEDEPSFMEKPVLVEEKKDTSASLAQEEKALPGFEKALPANRPSGGFSHRQKLFLTITVLLTLVLIGSVVIFQVRQQEQKQQALFASLYNPAKTKFDDASGLLDLNKALAIQDLQNAQQELQTAQGKFATSSHEGKQITTLLSQVTNTLTNAQKVPLLSAAQASDNASPLLTFAAKHEGTYIAADDTNFYVADSNVITQYNQKTNASKKIITADWKAIGGFDTYLGNMYVLDTTGSILKYVGTGSGFGNKVAYFASGVTPDVSKTVSMAIDSDVWILASDGTISKYTKGTQDNFAVSGLDTPLKNPTQIVTSVNLNNVYILDKGNERVVVLKKDGSFVAQYASDTVRTTSRIDISEKDKKIYLLSQGNVYQLDLK